MTIGILATGDEIVHGDTLNTNSHHIAQMLSSEGLALAYHLSCSDKEADIIDCLQFLTKKHDIILIIGGLGPTTDDLTRFAVAKFTQNELITHEKAATHISTFLHRGLDLLNAGNRQQTLFPKNARLLENPNGTALGCTFNYKTCCFYLLPGPPRECLPMFELQVMPLLRKSLHSQKQILKWRIFGLAESEISQRLEESLQNISCNTGYRWEPPYIEFKVRCTLDKMKQIKAIVDPILEPHIISPVNKKASQVLCEKLAEASLYLIINDQATGGALQNIVTTPKTKKYLEFSNQTQVSIPYFEITGLQEYWNEAKPGMTGLHLKYQLHNKKGEERVEIPYRTSLVLAHAVEWLCFRILQLINKLHQ